MRSPTRAVALALISLFALVASACGGETSTETHDAVEEPDIEDLAGNADVRLIEVLDVDTGEPTTLSATVTGDRPVLLWFWAPH